MLSPLDLGTELRISAGTLVWAAGDPGDFALVLQEGELEVVEASPDGDVLVLHTLEPGELAGETACLEGGGHSASVRARTACTVRRIAAAELRRAAADPAFVAALLRLQSGRVRRLSRQMAILGFEPVARRVARVLHEQGTPTVRLTHQELAERVAATREAVTKALAWLARQGLLRSARGRVEVEDARRLAELVRA